MVTLEQQKQIWEEVLSPDPRVWQIALIEMAVRAEQIKIGEYDRVVLQREPRMQ